MASDVTVSNLCKDALDKIGGGDAKFTIESINDGSATANLCLRKYPQVFKEVLCRAWWNEATKFADLGGELSGVEKAGWEYAFNLPSDYLGKCKQINQDYYYSTKIIIEYDKMIMQGKLFTNNYSNTDGDSAFIKYIFNLTDVSKFSPLLYAAVATKLAAELSPSILVDKGNVRRYFLLQEYESIVLPLAEGENAEEKGDNEDDGTYTALNVRTP